MGLFILKIFIAAGLIALSSLIAKSNPKLGGFILALPLTTMIAFLFADQLKLGFWNLYSAGVVLLGSGYFMHKSLLS